VLIALRREALAAAPLAFAASPQDDRGLLLEKVRESLANADASAVLGAFEDERLVAMVGVVRQDKIKWRHKALIWGMFVTPGVVQVGLSVSETAEEAHRLYRRAGFRAWGTEPRALQWEGRFVAEHHLVLDLT